MKPRTIVALLGAGALLCVAAPSWAVQYTYDALNRVTKVVYDNGDRIEYSYDAAGNIASVIRRGRSSVSVTAQLGAETREPAHAVFTFHGNDGETVTLRFEAVPPQAGLGKYVVMSLKGRADTAGPDAERETIARDRAIAMPAEMTVVLPYGGEFLVDVRGARDQVTRYAGPYRLTLEAAAASCASFKAKR